MLQNKEILSEILLECRDPDIRSDFSKFISSILQYVSTVENEIILDRIDVVNLNSLPYVKYMGFSYYSLYGKRYRAVSSRFIEHYLSEFLGEFKRNCRRIDDYLHVLKEYAKCGKKQKLLLIETGAIQELLSNINDNDKPGGETEAEDVYVLLESLICSTKTHAIRDSNNYPPNFENFDTNLDPQTENYLSDYRIKRNLINNFKLPSAESIILHLCWENIKFSVDFLEEFSTSLVSNKFDNNKVIHNLKILEKILKIRDEARFARVKEFLEITTIKHTYSVPMRQTFFEQIQKNKDNHSPFVMTIIVWWSDLMLEDHIFEVTKLHSQQFRWITVETFNRCSPYMMYDYLNKGANFEAEFNAAVQKFRRELDSDSEESVEIELDRFRTVEANPNTFKEDGEGESTGSENP